MSHSLLEFMAFGSFIWKQLLCVAVVAVSIPLYFVFSVVMNELLLLGFRWMVEFISGSGTERERERASYSFWLSMLLNKYDNRFLFVVTFQQEIFLYILCFGILFVFEYEFELHLICVDLSFVCFTENHMKRRAILIGGNETDWNI